MTNRPLAPSPWPWPQTPAPARVRPHGAFYLLPALVLAVGVACAALAGLRWVARHVLDPLRDSLTYGDGNPVPPHQAPGPDGSILLLLVCAWAAAVLAAAGFAGITAMRSCRR